VKMIRCVVQPYQVDEVVDALKASGVIGLTVTGAGGWDRQQASGRTVWRGHSYELRLRPEAVIDVTVDDDAADEIVGLVMRTCRIGEKREDGRIFVLPIEEIYSITTRQRCIA
jgi:nitrogen regulatory protein P-II 1